MEYFLHDGTRRIAYEDVMLPCNTWGAMNAYPLDTPRAAMMQ